MSYEPVADGELDAVVTYLEMSSPPLEAAASSSLSLQNIENPDPQGYR